MLRNIALLLALTTAACSSSSPAETSDGGSTIFNGGGDGSSASTGNDGTSSSSQMPGDPHPTWLVGELDGPLIKADDGSFMHWAFDFNADGTAVSVTQYLPPGSSDPTRTHADTTWTVLGDKIMIGADTFGLKVAAKCHAVQLLDGVDDRTYEISPDKDLAGCPYDVAPLGEQEQELVKVRYWRAGSVLLAFYDSRELWLSDIPAKRTMTFSIDADGKTMHWTDPNGVDILSGAFKPFSASFQLCPSDGSKCILWENDE